MTTDLVQEPLTSEQRIERLEAAIAELGKRSVQMTGGGGFANVCPSATAILREAEQAEAERRAAAIAGVPR